MTKDFRVSAEEHRHLPDPDIVIIEESVDVAQEEFQFLLELMQAAVDASLKNLNHITKVHESTRIISKS